MKRRMKIIGRHRRWVYGCVVSESYDPDDSYYRRYTATIDGWQGFKIYEGYIDAFDSVAEAVSARVRSIYERIKRGDESVFKEDTRIFPVK